MSLGREQALDGALAISVESISKAYSEIHETRYLPAVSVFAHLRERRRGPGGSGRGSTEEDEDDEELEETEELFPSEAAEGAALVDVSFDVRRGEAVGVIGSPQASAQTVGRILCGMTAPTAGRVVVRGRVAPTIELATALTRRETTARGVARRLAALAGPGRMRRGEYVRALLELAFGEQWDAVDLARPPKQVLRRVAAAAAFDPTADILVVDDLPDLGDGDFPARCRRRLVDRLSAGSAVVITAADPALVSDLCTRVVVLDEGRVARFGPAREVLAETARARTGGAQGEAAEAPADHGRESKAPRPLRSFSEHAAIHSVAVLRADGSPAELVRNDESVVVRVEFELAARESVLVVVRFVGAQTLAFVEQQELGEGGYVASLRIPAGAVPAGDYVIPVGLVLEREGDRRKVGRRQAARIRVDGDVEGLALLGETGAALQEDARPETSDAEWSFEEVFD